MLFNDVNGLSSGTNVLQFFGVHFSWSRKIIVNAKEFVSVRPHFNSSQTSFGKQVEHITLKPAARERALRGSLMSYFWESEC